MPPGGKRGSIAVVFVAWAVVDMDELEPPEAPVVAAAPPPLVAAASPVVWLLDVEAFALDEDDGESDDTASQLGASRVGFWYILLLWAFCRRKTKPDIS
jgi:hypothetical protein